MDGYEMMNGRVEEILTEAYKKTAHMIEIGARVLPRDLDEAWDTIKSFYRAIVEVPESLTMYDGFYRGAEKYNAISHIGMDHAFSSVIHEIGVRHESREWYEVMAYHYLMQADKVNHRWDLED